MRIFIAYRHTGADLDAARSALSLIKQRLAALGHEGYCTLIDGGPELCSAGSLQVLELGMRELSASNALLLYVESDALSAGMYIEVGIALALQKPVYLLKKSGVKQPYLQELASGTAEFSTSVDIDTCLLALLSGRTSTG